MPLKRALVVDDSRSARHALQKLLHVYDLQVDMAESGEAALEFLKRDTVDVIFMDHTMPGMDGLEAVTAIKSNPATATIPVMMYTTKEGEVYVGQARALGAMGVLPKNVQPHQLFEMLLNLGLVKERRDPATAEAAVDDHVLEPRVDANESSESGSALASTLADESDRSLEEQAMGMSVQNVVQRILEDQHLTLRADILRSHSAFAKEVAREVLKEEVLKESTLAEPISEQAGEVDLTTGNSSKQTQLSRFGAVALAILVSVAGFLAWQFKNERDTAMTQIVALEKARAEQSAQAAGNLAQAVSGVQNSAAASRQAGLDGLLWALNQDNATAFNTPAFSAKLAAQVQGVVPHLQALEFSGQLQLTSHLGRFCLVVDDSGAYQLAPDELPMLECDYLGHVWEDSSFVSDRLSTEFGQLMSEHGSALPEIVLQALEQGRSRMFVPYPRAPVSAGEWNKVARLNNRVTVSLREADWYAQGN